MKISKSSLTTPVVDFNELLSIYSEEHSVVHHVQIYGEDYIYRILGRKEFKKILSDDSLDEMDKEDMICKTCVLWPEDFDIDNINAGIPPMLCKSILENSFLDDISSTLRLLEYYTEEMDDLENQMICIISEAFPNYTLDEIESWNNLMFCKMFTRAEWKFNNLRNTELSSATEMIRKVVDLKDEGYDQDEIEEIIKEEQSQAQEEKQSGDIVFNSSPDEKVSRKGKEKLTPEKLAELQRKFPEIDWTADATKERVENNTETHLPVAQRTGTWAW